MINTFLLTFDKTKEASIIMTMMKISGNAVIENDFMLATLKKTNYFVG